MVTWREQLRQVKVKEDAPWRTWRSHRTVLHPKDTLEFRIGRSRVQDTERSKVEDRVSEMLQRADDAAAEQQRMRRERAERDRRRVEEQRRIAKEKAAAEQRRTHEAKLQARRDQATQLAASWRQAELMREFATALAASNDANAASWRQTVLEVADTLDPLAPGTRLPRWRRPRPDLGEAGRSRVEPKTRDGRLRGMLSSIYGDNREPAISFNAARRPAPSERRRARACPADRP